MDAQTAALGEHQQLGIEEPVTVLDLGHQVPGDIGSHRLEAALSIAEADSEREAEQPVVCAGDHLALDAAAHPGTLRQPGSDRHVAVAAEQRSHQRQESVQVGGEVDVHVGDHRGPAAQPGGGQGTATSPLLEAQVADSAQLGRQPQAGLRGRVGAGVVGDGDQGGEWEVVIQVVAQPAHARLQVTFLVVDGDHDLHQLADARGGCRSAHAPEVRGLASGPPPSRL